MWKYVQQSGALIDPLGEIIEQGYSGKVPEGYNRPEMESVSRVGPIPHGWYTIGPSIVFKKMKDCVRLTPYPATESFGRSGFLIHGDNKSHTASTGCIIMSLATRRIIIASGDTALNVVSTSANVTPERLSAVRVIRFKFK